MITNYYKENKEAMNANAKDWREKNRERFNEIHRRATQKRYLILKREVLTFYGFGKLHCVRCGFSDLGLYQLTI